MRRRVLCLPDAAMLCLSVLLAERRLRVDPVSYQHCLVECDGRRGCEQAAPLAHAGSGGASGFTMGGGDQQRAARRVVRAKRPGRR